MCGCVCVCVSKYLWATEKRVLGTGWGGPANIFGSLCALIFNNIRDFSFDHFNKFDRNLIFEDVAPSTYFSLFKGRHLPETRFKQWITSRNNSTNHAATTQGCLKKEIVRMIGMNENCTTLWTAGPFNISRQMQNTTQGGQLFYKIATKVKGRNHEP